jgi:hypothetical protein
MLACAFLSAAASGRLLDIIGFKSFGQKIETLYGKRTRREICATCHHVETS